VEIEAKKAAGYFTPEIETENPAGMVGRGLNDY
jgi:hypothetical protein